MGVVYMCVYAWEAILRELYEFTISDVASILLLKEMIWLDKYLYNGSFLFF